jgi:predicted nucleic acid-binding protein
MFLPYLFDSSSLVYAVRLKRIDVLAGNYIQELTVYEVLNILWKETYALRKMSRKEAESLLDVFIQLLSYLNILDLKGLESEVFKIAVETGLTVYDASYLALAHRGKLTLVTEDVKLRNVASTMIQAVSLDELIA